MPKRAKSKTVDQIIHETQMGALKAGKDGCTLPSDGPPLMIKYRALDGTIKEVDMRGSQVLFGKEKRASK